MLDFKTLSVYELNSAIKETLENAFFYCLVEGELSNVARPQSGHIYFNLKDGDSSIRCVMWRQTAMQFTDLIDNGIQVQVKAKVSVYVPRGEYQLVVSHIELAGIGDLYKAFEVLKNRLSLEGLFDERYKKTIKKHPKAIGIITSGTGAALQDALYVLNETRPDVPIIIYPTLVQGEKAADSIVKTIRIAHQEKKVDVILLIRGGGSIEDLWPFNEERVARAIYAADIPIISGIGHETDTTIADFVADCRAPTPSVAAKMAAVSKEELLQFLDQSQKSLINNIHNYLARNHKIHEASYEKLLILHPKNVVSKQAGYLEQLMLRLKNSVAIIVEKQQIEFKQYQRALTKERLEVLYENTQKALINDKNQLIRLMDQRLIEKQDELMNRAALLDSFSPLKILGRGYSLSYKIDSKGNEIPLKNIKQVKLKEQIRVRLGQGSLVATVDESYIAKN